ncbi:MAG: CpsB/CapC family capsule biosynthesis tyrosine phosphatase [Candidatus Latescibacterota bacterium]
MIDIHCHLLPNVDDGPKSWNECLAMIATGMEEGICTFVATPHFLDDLNADRNRLFRARFSELEQLLEREGLGAEVVLGSEIFYQYDLERIRDLEAATLGGNGRYFLLELPLASFPPHLEEALARLRTLGLVPILAHAERYVRHSGNMKRLRELIHGGTLVQVNSGSLTGRFGRHIRKAAQKLLADNLVHFVATDAHNLTTRPPLVREAMEVVADLKGPETVRRLFDTNPGLAIRGEWIETEIDSDLEDRVSPSQRFWRKLIGQRV